MTAAERIALKTSSKVTIETLPLTSAREVMAPEVLGSLEVPLLRAIAQITSHDVLYPLLEAIDDDDNIESCRILHTAQATGVTEFWRLVAIARKVKENNGAQKLADLGAEHDDGESDSHFIARCLLQDRERFDKVVTATKHLSEDQGVGRSMQFYACRLNPKEIQARRSKIQVVEMKALLRNLMKKNTSNYWAIQPFENNTHWGFLVSHGQRPAVETLVNEAENDAYFEKRRKLKTEILQVSKVSGYLMINANLTHGPIYAAALGILMGDERIFGRRLNFDLQRLLSQDLGSKLIGAARQLGCARIELKLALVKDGLFTVRAPAPKNKCLTEQFSSYPFINLAIRLQMGVLRIVHSTDGKEYTDIELRSQMVKVLSGIGHDDVMDLLSYLQILIGPSNA